jgi:hypothetical protein
VGSCGRWCRSPRNAGSHYSNIQDQLHLRLAGKVRTPLFVAALPSHPLIDFESPRDAVTISRTFNDATTIIDVSTSLPRSPDEPAYLRPSPPYVRSNVKREYSFLSNDRSLTTYMQYLHGAYNHYHLHPLSRRPLVTHLHVNRIQGASALRASGSMTFALCGILAQ